MKFLILFKVLIYLQAQKDKQQFYIRNVESEQYVGYDPGRPSIILVPKTDEQYLLQFEVQGTNNFIHPIFDLTACLCTADTVYFRSCLKNKEEVFVINVQIKSICGSSGCLEAIKQETKVDGVTIIKYSIGTSIVPTTQWEVLTISCEQCDKCNYPDPWQNIGTCLACPKDLNIASHPTNNKCDCDEGYFPDPEDTKTCLKCQLQCKTCEKTSKQCTKCISYENMVYEEKAQSCYCSPGLYLNRDSLKCSLCKTACKECIASNKCTTCHPEQFREINGNDCVCISNYFESSFQCLACHVSCAGCQNTSRECINCPSKVVTKRLDRSQTSLKSCPCDQGYVEAELLICMRCHINCLKCIIEDIDQCQVCIEAIRVPEQKGCPCGAGYAALDGEICQLCDMNCLECLTYIEKCTKCHLERVLIDDKCQCREGFKEVFPTKTCQICLLNCTECKEKFPCELCDGTNCLPIESVSSVEVISVVSTLSAEKEQTTPPDKQDDFQARLGIFCQKVYNNTMESPSDQVRNIVALQIYIGVTGKLIRSTQLIISTMFVEFDHPESVYQLHRALTLFTIPASISKDQLQPDRTKYILFKNDITQYVALKSLKRKKRLIGVSSVTILTLLDVVCILLILLIIELLRILIFEKILKNPASSINTTLQLVEYKVFYMTFEGNFGYLFISCFVTLSMPQELFEIGVLGYLSFIFVILLLALYGFHFRIIFFGIKSYYLQRQAFSPKDQMDESDQQKLEEIDLNANKSLQQYIEKVKKQSYFTIYFTLLSEIKKLLMAIIIVAFGEYQLIQLVLLSLVASVQLLYILYFQPYISRIYFLLEFTMQSLFLTIVISQILDLRASQYVKSQNSITIYFILVGGLVNLVKTFFIYINRFLINRQKKKEDKLKQKVKEINQSEHSSKFLIVLSQVQGSGEEYLSSYEENYQQVDNRYNYDQIIGQPFNQQQIDDEYSCNSGQQILIQQFKVSCQQCKEERRFNQPQYSSGQYSEENEESKENYSQGKIQQSHLIYLEYDSSSQYQSSENAEQYPDLDPPENLGQPYLIINKYTRDISYLAYFK